MELALASGVAPEVWLSDGRAMFTALELLDERRQQQQDGGDGPRVIASG